MSETEPQYDGIADLRGALRSDSEDTLQEAYEAVYDAGTRPSEVLGSEPPLQTLRDHGVIPPAEDRGPRTTEWRASVLAELEAIRSALDGSGGS